MKITFVTESHLAGDDKKTVDVAKQNDLAKTNARIDALCERFDDFGRMLAAVERRLDRVEESLQNFDAHLREDSKNIFNDIIEESLAPVFTVMKQLVKEKGCCDFSSGENGQAQKKTAKTSPKSVKNPKGKSTKASSDKRKTATRMAGA